MFNFKPEFDPTTNTLTLKITGEFIPKYSKALNTFLDVYEFDAIVAHPKRKYRLKPKADRVCRFCLKSVKDGATFKMDAHLVPQLMGNANILSDSECDACNEMFSKYETQLSYFMGLSRTLMFARGQRGIPKFKAPDKNLVAGLMKNKGLKIISIGNENDHFSLDEENKTLSISTLKHPYKPMDVFKALAKIGYSFLPEDELQNYERLRKILISDKNDDRINGMPYFKLLGFLCPGPPFPAPMIFSCKKRTDRADVNCLSRTYIIYFHNCVYQIYMPFCERDKWLHQKGAEAQFLRMPPFMDKKWIEEFDEPSPFIIDLSSKDVKRNEPQIVTMSFDSVEHDDNPSQEEPDDEKFA